MADLGQNKFSHIFCSTSWGFLFVDFLHLHHSKYCFIRRFSFTPTLKGAENQMFLFNGAQCSPEFIPQ